MENVTLDLRSTLGTMQLCLRPAVTQDTAPVSARIDHPMFGVLNSASAFKDEQYADGTARRAFMMIARLALAFHKAQERLNIITLATTKEEARKGREASEASSVKFDRKVTDAALERASLLRTAYMHGSNMFFALYQNVIGPEDFDAFMVRLDVATLLGDAEYRSVLLPDEVPADLVR